MASSTQKKTTTKKSGSRSGSRTAKGKQPQKRPIRREVGGVILLVLALCVQVLPVFVKKQQLDVFATELVREAEISGRVGAETDRREESLIEKTGLEPDISWSQEGRVQLNKDVSVTLTYETNIGLFGKFGSFPVTLRAEASGKSEVYWK